MSRKILLEEQLAGVRSARSLAKNLTLSEQDGCDAAIRTLAWMSKNQHILRLAKALYEDARVQTVMEAFKDHDPVVDLGRRI
jgi:hypothetical protein